MSALAIIGPILHQAAALLEQVAASIGGLNGVADRVRKRLLYDMVRIVVVSAAQSLKLLLNPCTVHPAASLLRMGWKACG